MGLFKEFKEFALKGNMIDLAVGVIIGAAFGGLVKSLVDDVLMPPLGWLTGGLDFADKAIVIQKAGEQHAITGQVLAKDVVFGYGKFITLVINFLIVAICIFVVIKMMNTLRRRQEAAPTAPPGPTEDQKLLMEIRDILKSK